MRRYHSTGDTRKRRQRHRQILSTVDKAERANPEIWANRHNWNSRSPFDCGNPECSVCQNPRYRDKPRRKKYPLYLEQEDGDGHN